MEQPSTSLRRSPRIALAIFIIGILIGGLGLLLELGQRASG